MVLMTPITSVWEAGSRIVRGRGIGCGIIFLVPRLCLGMPHRRLRLLGSPGRKASRCPFNQIMLSGHSPDTGRLPGSAW